MTDSSGDIACVVEHAQPVHDVFYIFQVTVASVAVMTIWRKIFTYLVRPLGDNFANTQCCYKFGNSNNLFNDNEKESERETREKQTQSSKTNTEQNALKSAMQDVLGSGTLSNSNNNNNNNNINNTNCTFDRSNKHFLKYSDKYCEELWKAITMTLVVIFGIFALYDKEYFFNPKLIFDKYPQSEPIELIWFYRVAMGYHGHRAIYQFFDTKRKDLIAMTLHHWVTLGLIAGSMFWGLAEIGSLVMVCHDNADALLSFAKVSGYHSAEFLKNTFFFLFLSSWILCRITMFSTKVIIPLINAYPYYGCHFSYPFFVFALLILLGLHLYWLTMIAKIAITKLRGGIVTDTRSD